MRDTPDTVKMGNLGNLSPQGSVAVSGLDP